MEFTANTIKFLSETGGFYCELPDTVDPAAPEMTSVVTYGDGQDYIGASRSIAMTWGDPPESQDHLEPLGSMESDGLTVFKFRTKEEPALLLAIWRLGEQQFLGTFAPEATNGKEILSTVIDSVTVGKADGWPLIALSPPVTGGDIRNPRMRDEINFYGYPGEEKHWMVSLRREPSWALEDANAKTQYHEGTVRAEMTSSNSVHIFVQSNAADEATVGETAERIATSLDGSS